jgi:hypothetical protein
MPTCRQCGDVRESPASTCPKCGAGVVFGENDEVDGADTLPPPPGPRSGEAGVIATERIAPAGAWSESEPPPAPLPRRSSVTPLLRAATARYGQRHSAALAFEPIRVPEPSALAPAKPHARAGQQAAPNGEAAISKAQVVLLHRNEAPVSLGRPGDIPVAEDGRRVGAEARVPLSGELSDPPSQAGPKAPEPTARATPTAQPAARLADGHRLTPSAQSAGRPPVLASEALRKDLAPATPAAPGVRKVTATIGVVGFSIAIAICGESGLGLPLGGAFLALAMLSIVPMSYQARAAALVTVAGSGLAIVTWSRIEAATDLERLVLLIGVLLLAAALLFRSWHRASLLARALVALGTSACAGWLAMSDSLEELLILEAGWYHWLPAVLPLPLAIVLLLALLAFMDSRSTGGCGAWASLLLGWYALYAWAELIPLYWPAPARAFAGAAVDPNFAVSILSGPLFTVVLAAALAQLMSVATAADRE